MVDIYGSNFHINTLHKWFLRNTVLNIQLKIQAVSEFQAFQLCTFII